MHEQPVRRIRPGSSSPAPGDGGPWPLTVPAVQQILRDGLDLAPGITVLVGENASGKSTVIELVAAVLGLNPEGGSVDARYETRASEPSSLGLIVERSASANRWAYLLRDETLHGLYTYLEETDSNRRDPLWHQMSHGEALLDILASRMRGGGLFLLDEPDAALSFQGSLSLVGLLLQFRDERAQALVATHSPMVAAIPGAQLLEVGPWGLRQVSWEELEIVAHWRRFLDSPEAYLRHLL